MKKMKIVCTDISSVTKGDIDISVLEKFGEVVTYEYTAPDKTAERIKDADIVLVNKTTIGRNEMESAENLKYIGIFATGFNIIDLKCANEKGIIVSNAGQYSTNAVAQHTFALILEIFSKVGFYNNFVQDGGWKNTDIFTAFFGGTDEIYGKTLGIIGYGSIGKAVAKIANAFGMEVLINTRTPQKDSNVKFVEQNELFEKSDIITIHCPLTENTSKMINEKNLSKCKNGVYIINTSRGGVIDEDALANALIEKKVAGAALDVLEQEPMSPNCPLFGLDNTIITPHVAWSPLRTRERLMNIVVSNIEAFLSGNPTNVVNGKA